MTAPSEAELRQTREYVELAHALLRRAEIDTELIDRDYEQQMARFVAATGREPTSDERFEAFLKENKEMIELMDAFDDMEEELLKQGIGLRVNRGAESDTLA